MTEYAREKALEAINSTLVRLVELFPKAFHPWEETPKPLKIGIYADIRRRHPDLSGKKVHNTLHHYTRSNRYLETLIAGAERFDLDGETCGHVTSEQEAVAEALRISRARRNKSKRKPKNKTAPEVVQPVA
jgi:ProP effector